MPVREESHFLVCMCLFCVVLVVLFGAGHLIESWSLIAQGCMLDLLGDVTSNVSSCQLSGGVCYPVICMHKFSCFVWAYWAYKVSNYYIFVLFLSLFFVICINFIHKFYIDLVHISRHGKLDSFSSVPGCLCTCEVGLICQVSFVHFVVTCPMFCTCQSIISLAGIDWL